MSSPPRFRRLGGSYQLVIDGPADLDHLLRLDPSRWLATSAPLDGLVADEGLLAFVDAGGTGRIGPDELKAAVAWLRRHLADTSQLGADRLQLASIDTSHASGEALHAAAVQILANLNQPDARSIGLDQVRDRKKIMAGGATNGDGVIPPSAVQDADLQTFVRDLVRTVGSAGDASGTEGVEEAHLDAFLEHAGAWLTWAEAPVNQPEIWPLGDDTAAAWSALSAISAKLDDWFRLGELATFDPRVREQLKLGDDALAALSDAAATLEAAPLADLVPVLDDAGWVNPAWQERLEGFLQQVHARLEPPARLDARRWARIQAWLAPYAAWRASEPSHPVRTLGGETLSRYVGEPRYADTLRRLVAFDKEVADELEQMASVERLLVYQRDLLELCNNFVSFPRFYDPKVRSMLEQGTLVMDGRRFDLALRVTHRADHVKKALEGQIFLMYVRVEAPEPYEVAVAVTSRWKGRLFDGKRGVFIDREGRVLDAVVVQLLDNPISLWEAISRPFARLGGMIAARLKSFSDARLTEIEKETGGEGTKNMLVNGGVAVAALSSSAAYIAKTLSELEATALLRNVAILVAVMTLPAVVAAAWKLAQRDLGIVLEASGWAINEKMRLPRWAGPVFTRTPPLPEGAQLSHGELLVAFRRSAREAHEAPRWRVALFATLLVLTSALAGWIWLG